MADEKPNGRTIIDKGVLLSLGVVLAVISASGLGIYKAGQLATILEVQNVEIVRLNSRLDRLETSAGLASTAQGLQTVQLEQRLTRMQTILERLDQSDRERRGQLQVPRP